MNNKQLDTARLILIPVTEDDIEHIHLLHSMPETDEYNTLGIPENIRQTEKVLKQWLADIGGGRSFIFAIQLKNNAEFIGLIAINLGRAKFRNAEVWFKFNKDHWNKGYATESLKEILRFGFQDLRLHRIEAGCAVENIGSAIVLEKAGMIREAHTRKLLPLKSGWADNYGYAILSTDPL